MVGLSKSAAQSGLLPSQPGKDELRDGRPLWDAMLWHGPELYSLAGRRAMGTVTTNLVVDESAPVDVGTLRDILCASFTKVADIFRDIDANGDGAISCSEFRRVVLDDLGLAKAGATPEAVDELFHELDTSGDGEIEYSELNAVLRGGAIVALDPAPRVMERVYMGVRPNWSMRTVNGASGVVLHVASESKLMRKKGKKPKPTSASVERLALPKVASRAGMLGAPEPVAGPSRSVDQLVQHLESTPTESYRMRTEPVRSRPHEVHSPIPAEHKARSTADNVWWSKGSLSPFP